MVERSYQAALARRSIGRTSVTRGADAAARCGRLSRRLTVRGGDKFLFEKRGPAGAMIRLGTDGVRAIGSSRPRGRSSASRTTTSFLPAWMRRTSTDVAYLQVSTLLERMRDYYQLQAAADGIATCRTGRSCRIWEPTWSAGRLQAVEVWPDAAGGGGVVGRSRDRRRRAISADAADRRVAAAQAHMVTLRLVEEKSLGDEAYRAEIERRSGSR